MAYDKVVDSAALEAALKASADAIRGKTGGSGSIPWDAVKGFAEAIAAIEAGGSSGGEFPDFGMQVVSGTHTPSSDEKASTTSVGYPLPFTPKIAIIWCEDLFTEAVSVSSIVFGAIMQSEIGCEYDGKTYHYACTWCTKTTAGAFVTSGTKLTSQHDYIRVYNTSSNYSAGKTYNWVAWG